MSYHKNKCSKDVLFTLGQGLYNVIEIKSISCQTPELCSCKVGGFYLKTPKNSDITEDGFRKMKYLKNCKAGTPKLFSIWTYMQTSISKRFDIQCQTYRFFLYVFKQGMWRFCTRTLCAQNGQNRTKSDFIIMLLESSYKVKNDIWIISYHPNLNFCYS